MNGKFAMAIHGGAGTLSKENMTEDQRREHEDALLAALEEGVRLLERGSSSLDATEAAVIALEDCALFNAGKGSVFNRDGGHEMDAAIMDGSSLRAGAIAGISQVKNPIRLARAVLDRGDYVLLCGDQALAFARAEQLPLEDNEYFYTPMRYEEWQRVQREGNAALSNKFGTVGAVALDSRGHLAAATSTGGLVNKAYGRVGDSCVIGAGTYANDETCAISCTGDGEAFIRAVAAYDIACLVEYRQLPLPEACDRVLSGKVLKLGGTGGLIALHRSGLIAMPFTSEGMYRACHHLNGAIEVGIF
jgi:beta-aspartyl-peptidase (threonine type)